MIQLETLLSLLSNCTYSSSQPAQRMIVANVVHVVEVAIVAVTAVQVSPAALLCLDKTYVMVVIVDVTVVSQCARWNCS